MTKHLHVCRFCSSSLSETFADLGMSPLANAYLKTDQLEEMEPFFPLHARVCRECLLVQLPVFQSSEDIFSEYAYFSSYSESWLKHAKDYTDNMIDRFGFDSTSQVMELASNDGYLLQYFKKRGVPILGIEPAENVANAAIQSGIPTIVRFFGKNLAKELIEGKQQADLLIGNNVLAHVPDVTDFVSGMKMVLKPNGIITMEFPHLMKLIAENQFDTIYHEHFSYFSFLTVRRIFSSIGLTLFDVEELPTHGGSLRIYACHDGDSTKTIHPRVGHLLQKETEAQYHTLPFYLTFAEKVKETKRRILTFLIQAKKEGKSIAAYGAPAKGNTLLNYCGIGTDFIDYTVDRSPHKQNHFLPGSHIPIYHPDKIRETHPDYLVILPWNLKDEIIDQMEYIRDWNGRFVTLIPDVKVFN